MSHSTNSQYTYISNMLSLFTYRCQYVDPPDRNQGSAVINGSMHGALGLVARRVILNNQVVSLPIRLPVNSIHNIMHCVPLT